ncbi:ABC transporter ATP-binding protein [Paenibacillus alkalitolerans]|uniref:ABC transporter ATP-binding protein n=1 Tax=Paenibacillus alkalitolerans TaxID=2799335 RepID=UPI0018F30F4C|nr:ABC transporter ATP-binding protein [Paenibacillus alkalitolerans]
MSSKERITRWQVYRRSFGTLLRLLRLCAKLSPKEMAVVMAINSVRGFIPLAVLFSLQNLIDAVGDAAAGRQGVSQQVTVWLAAFVLALLLSRFMQFFGDLIASHVQEIVKERCQREIMQKAYRLSLADFDQSEFYDRLKRVNKGMDRRFFTTMSFIFHIITEVFSLVSILFYLVFIHWAIPLALFAGSLTFTLVLVRSLKEKYLLHRKQTTPGRQLQYLGSMMTTRDTASELRLYGLKDHVLQAWTLLNRQLIGERLKLARREYRLNLFSSTGHTFTFALVIIGMFLLGTKGLLSIGKLAAFLRAVQSFQRDLNHMMWTTALVQNDLRYIEDFFEYLDLPEEERTGIELPAGQPLKLGIQFCNVGFAYPGNDYMVLKDLDLDIRPGEKIALIGDNGCGKSTLVKLLLGLYKPTKGTVMIDGIDLNEIDLNSWRVKTTAIFQDFHKYHLLSVGENISIGQIENIEDKERLHKAALQSGAEAMIRTLPEEYDTLLGKEFGGTELSRGQWQKIAVARAYFRDSELLILDEPTASLDAKAEVEIYRQFEQVTQGKTVVFISHRLGVAKLADRIIVLKDGRIEEEGTYAELVERNGYYAEMYRLQAQWYQ